MSRFTDSKAYDPRERRDCMTYSMLPLASAIILFVALVDVYSLLYASHILKSVYADDDTSGLPLGDPYIGLTALYASRTVNATKLRDHHIRNKPRIVAPIFADRPTERTPEEDLIVNGYFGTLSPHEKHFKIDPQRLDGYDCAIPDC
ncbi:hypothetical protein EVJ58_g8144 [Rhodofomes roseus]|uniref:Uncharacterized protein n=1 Tax=Rhodofomes roseus TaxID=34475 RepID=A0A4Y9XZU7_9APHY|nr:hypothetical protein EVJ58_g8144 [Rhodofomes roseus]